MRFNYHHETSLLITSILIYHLMYMYSVNHFFKILIKFHFWIQLNKWKSIKKFDVLVFHKNGILYMTLKSELTTTFPTFPINKTIIQVKLKAYLLRHENKALNWQQTEKMNLKPHRLSFCLLIYVKAIILKEN